VELLAQEPREVQYRWKITESIPAICHQAANQIVLQQFRHHITNRIQEGA
jgi:hypothetical protein